MTTHSLTVSCKVISLKTSFERRLSIEKNLKDFGLKWQFFDACLSNNDIGLISDVDNQLIKFGRPLLPAEIGCFKSHFSVLADFLNNSTNEWLLVLEDDVLIDVNFDINELVSFLTDHEISYFRLFCKKNKPSRTIGAFKEYEILRYFSDPFGTQAYLINKHGAKQLLGTLDRIEFPIDDEIGRFWIHKLPIIGIFPFPIIEKSVTSTVSDGRDTRYSKLDGNLKIRRLLFRLREKIKKIAANFLFRIRYIS